MNDVTLADAKAHLSELISRAAHGDAVRITRRGKPVAQLGPGATPRKPVDLAALRAVTDAMPLQADPAAQVIRRMREDARY